MSRMTGLCQCGCGERAPIATKTDSRGGYRKGEPRRFIAAHINRGRRHTPEWIAEMSVRNSGAGNPMHGRKHSPEKLATMRGEGHPQFGKRGAEAPVFKGGRRLDVNGYVLVLVDESHPFFGMAMRAGGNGGAKRGSWYVFEHRLVMAEHLGRALLPEETVHHLTPDEGGTGDKTDNRIGMLRLFPSAQAHIAHHAALRRAQAA